MYIQVSSFYQIDVFELFNMWYSPTISEIKLDIFLHFAEGRSLSPVLFENYSSYTYSRVITLQLQSSY